MGCCKKEKKKKCHCKKRKKKCCCSLCHRNFDPCIHPFSTCRRFFFDDPCRCRRRFDFHDFHDFL